MPAKPTLAGISVIAFDLDDTLWPCMPTIHRAEETLYRWLERHYPRITAAHDAAQIVELRREFSRREPRYAIDMTALRREFLQYLGERHGYDGDTLAARGFEVFFAARQQVEFYADVVPCLERLRRRYRLGAISNGNASVEHVGLGHLIEHAVGASDLQLAKPDPGIFHHLAERFAAEPAQIAYVGDHPEYDVQGSREAGLRAIWINREGLAWPGDLPSPEHEVGDLHELEALLSD